MSEIHPSDSQLNALSGTLDNEQEVLFIATGESPYYTSFYKMLYRMLNVARRAGDLRVYKDGALTFGVRAGAFLDGPALRAYAGATAQALTNNATNYVYLTTAGALTVDTAGFPVTPHVPLATIVTSGGAYDFANLADCRGRAMFRPVGGLAITASAESANGRTVTITGGPYRQRIRVWIATADFGSPDATGNTFALVTGTQLAQVVANADYTLITDGTGVAAFTITIAGAATRYVLAEVDGRIISSGPLAWV